MVSERSRSARGPVEGFQGLKVGVAFSGDPRAPESWSGTASGITRGLESHGVEVTALNVELPRELGVPLRLAVGLFWRKRAFFSPITPQYAAVQSLVVRSRWRRAENLDGIIQIGTEYTLPRASRVVTLEDMTVPQVLERYPTWQRLPSTIVEARLERQRRAYHDAVACCAMSSWAAESIVEDHGVARGKVHVVGGGRNLSAVSADRDWATPRYLFAGIDWKRKNGPAVLRAFERLRRDRPDARLDVVGGHPPLVAPGVTGHGVLRLDRADQRAQLEALFAGATCFVMPSWIEPFGLAYVDAAAAGLALIGTSEGGSADIIGDGGRVVHPADENGLFAAMQAFADPQTAREAGMLAKRRSELFTWPLVGGRLLRALDLPRDSRDSWPEYLETF